MGKLTWRNFRAQVCVANPGFYEESTYCVGLGGHCLVTSLHRGQEAARTCKRRSHGSLEKALYHCMSGRQLLGGGRAVHVSSSKGSDRLSGGSGDMSTFVPGWSTPEQRRVSLDD